MKGLGWKEYKKFLQRNYLAEMDPVVDMLIQKEEQRQIYGAELIASENYTSPAVLEALATCLSHKYAEGYPGRRYYAGCEYYDEIESIAIERAKKLFGAEYANVQPLSGNPANLAVYFAFLNPGDTILAMALDHGGHLSHGHKSNFSGKLWNFVWYHTSKKDGRIDMEEVEKLAREHKPKMIVVGYSAYPRVPDWKWFRDIAEDVGAYTFADISHISGLIAGKQIPSPIDADFDVVMTTTHKTLRGPRGALILCKEEFGKDIDKAVFPMVQSGPHMHAIAAKAVCFKEAMTPEFRAYTKRIIDNAKRMARVMKEFDYKIVTDGTDNHLLLVDLRNKDIRGKQAQETLEKAYIFVNKNVIPWDPNPPTDPSGIRIGTPIISTRGLKPDDVEVLTQFIDRVLGGEDPAEVRREVMEFMGQFPIFAWYN